MKCIRKLQKIILSAFDISHGLFWHTPAREIRDFKILFLRRGLSRFYVDNLYFAKTMNKTKRGKAGCSYSGVGFSQAACCLFFPDLLHIVFQISRVLIIQRFFLVRINGQPCKNKIGFGDKFIWRVNQLPGRSEPAILCQAILVNPFFFNFSRKITWDKRS